MVRPGMKRLLDAQRVQVQPNKTGTSVMLGGSVYLNNRRQRVVFSETPGTPYNDLHDTREFANSKDTTVDNQRKCACATVYAKDDNGRIIPYK